MTSSLDGLRVLDLSRVLAGPVCTQILGDLGAEIIKIERPGAGDDTRAWGPPFLKDDNGNDTAESAYYLSCNRNKKSLTVDISKPEGQKIIRALMAKSDIVIENFKVGGLEKYGLGYEQIKGEFPKIIYCAISGFGQNGPLAPEPGYDFLAQAMGGLMSATGEVDGSPMKAGVALSDVMTGLYAAIGILAALNHRHQTGFGQMVDVSLLDVTLASMTNLAQYYLTSGNVAPRQGNAHATIVPYQTFGTKDGHIVIAIGNDAQFKLFCRHIGQADWTDDARFRKNKDRVKNRDALTAMISADIKNKTTEQWMALFREADIPAAPVQKMDDVFAMEQIAARNMNISLPHQASASPVHLVGSPLKLSASPVTYRAAPPTLGQDTDDVLRTILNLKDGDIRALKDKGIV